jgi:hypothetical protein
MGIGNIDKYLKQVDLVELYITKNICKIIKNKKELKFIKSNIFLLGFLNKNRKNSLNILLENSEYEIIIKLIKEFPQILNYKNKYEINLFQSILVIEKFYDLVIEILEKYNYDLVLKIVVNKDIKGFNSVDLIISILTININNFIENLVDNKSFLIVKKMLKLIYNLDREDLTLVITKLCKNISNSKLLLDILKYIGPNNIDIYPDNSMMTCVDNLLIKEDFEVLKYLIPKINYIYFINTENNFLFDFIDNINKYENTNKEDFVKLIFEILSKSNIAKIKNIKNENIFFKIFQYYKLNPKIIKKHIEMIDIFEENIYGNNIYEIIKINYGNKIKLSNNKSKIFLLDFSKLLEKTDTGMFISNILHNMLYTNIILEKYTNIIIPYYFQSKEYNKEHYKLINISNNEKFVMSMVKSYFNYFNTWIPFIIIWKNRNDYYFDENLLKSLILHKNTKYIYIRLSLNLLDIDNVEAVRHANVIIIDNENKIVERFEPYGELNYFNSEDINSMITERIAKTLNYEFVFVQPYPGFQTRSDEFNKFNKVYGDPGGYCLAWCLLYIETKMLIDIKTGSDKKTNTNPIDCINYYIINQFKKDFPEFAKENQNNIYMRFIRFYAKKLDSEKNKLLKSMGINLSIIYNLDIVDDTYNDVITKLNKQIYKNCEKNKK